MLRRLVATCILSSRKQPLNPFPYVMRGDTAGTVYYEASVGASNYLRDNGAAIPFALAMPEWTGDDERAENIWGDIYLDCTPATTLTCQPYSLNATVGSATVLPASARVQTTVSLGGGVLLNFLGLLITGSEGSDGAQTASSEINLWQPSLLAQPESIADRITDWDDCGTPAAKFIQGFILNADTFGADKQIAVRNGDTQAITQTFTVNHTGQQEKAYSFDTPFIAHLVRLEPQDASIQWRLFGPSAKFVYQPTPEDCHHLADAAHRARARRVYACQAADGELTRRRRP
jgi:hypothetical protein